MTPILIVTQTAGQAPHVFWASDAHVVAAVARLDDPAPLGLEVAWDRYPMVAAAYAAKRSQLARDLGLGRKGADARAATRAAMSVLFMDISGPLGSTRLLAEDGRAVHGGVKKAILLLALPLAKAQSRVPRQFDRLDRSFGVFQQMGMAFEVKRTDRQLRVLQAHPLGRQRSADGAYAQRGREAQDVVPMSTDQS